MGYSQGCFFYHCAVILKHVNHVWDPNPFRFNNHWLSHNSFPDTIHSIQNVIDISDWKDFVLKKKLKDLKLVFKSWNKQVFGNIDSHIDNI